MSTRLLAFLATLRETNYSDYFVQGHVSTLAIPAHSSNSKPIPLLQYACTMLPWSILCLLAGPPSTPNVQPIRGRIAICDTLPIRGTTTSPAMPRLGDGACVCLCRRRQVWTSLTLCSFILPYKRHLTISRSFLTFAVFSHSFIPWLLWALAPATT